jgi:hypothetical protein
MSVLYRQFPGLHLGHDGRGPSKPRDSGSPSIAEPPLRAPWMSFTLKR